MSVSKVFIPLKDTIGRLSSVALLFFLLGCQSPTEPTLRVQWSAEPVALNPWQAEDGTAMKVLHALWEVWVEVDLNGGRRVTGRLAKSWNWDASGRVLRVEIRENARWSDGAPVTAEQARAGILHTLDPRTGSKMSGFFLDIQGARAFQKGKVSPEQVGVRVRGPRIFEISFVKRRPYGVLLLSLLSSAPLRSEFLTDRGEYPLAAPTTGSFRVEKWERGVELRLRAQDFPLEKKPAIQNVSFTLVTDETTALNLFETGRLHIASRVPVADLKRLRAMGLVHTDPFLATYYLAFRMDLGLGRRYKLSSTEFLHLRQDLSAAIDRQGLVQALDTGDLPSTHFLPEVLGGQSSDSVLSRAKLYRKNWGLSLTVDVDSSSRNRLILEKIQQDWKNQLGVDLKIQTRDWKSHIRQIESDPSDLYRFGWLAPFADPLTHLLVFTSDSPHNYTRWKNARYDAAVEEVAGLPLASPQRLQAQRRADTILTQEDAVVLPLFQYVQTHLVSAAVAGFAVNPQGVLQLDRMRWALEGSE